MMSNSFNQTTHHHPQDVFYFSGRQRGASKIQLTNQQRQNTKIRIALFLVIDTLVTGNLATQPAAPGRSGAAAPTNE
jgi:hypothetical protein